MEKEDGSRPLKDKKGKCKHQVRKIRRGEVF